MSNDSAYMMKQAARLAIIVLLTLLLPENIKAQTFPSLPDDPSVETGVLPNGIRYYIAENRTIKGLADFAIVQKYADDSSSCSLSPQTLAGRVLDTLPRFASRNPEMFLTSHGMGAKRGVVAEFRDDAIIYRFESFSTVHGEPAIDSTLLMSFDIIGGGPMSEDRCFKSKFPTASSAIIISGDVDKAAIVQKLKLLSLIVPERKAASDSLIYEWKPTDSSHFTIVNEPEMDYARLSFNYKSQRTPQEYMTTVLPVVSSRLGKMLGIILKKRLYEEFRTKNIPVGFIDYNYASSSDVSGDEQYTIVITVPDTMAVKAVGAVASVLSYIDTRGVEAEEYSVVKDEYLVNIYDEARRPVVTNRSNVDRCISAFLYGSGLHPMMDRFKLFMSAGMSAEQSSGLFNNFASGLLDRDRNLSVTCVCPDENLTEAELRKSFTDSWDEMASGSSVLVYPLRALPQTPAPVNKLKVLSDKREYISGGRLWTFENGMRVVYKRMPTEGMTHYAMFIKGGYSMMEDIRKGEGAFLGDVLETFDIQGLSSEEFHYMLGAKGITMSSRVGISAMELYGKTISSSLESLIDALKAVALHRKPNEQAFKYMRECVNIELKEKKGTVGERLTIIDSLMCPGYNYSFERSEGHIPDDLCQRATAFYNEQFSRVNEGIFVIVSDLEETQVKKMLQTKLSGFRTSMILTNNIRLPYQPISGWSIYTQDGPSPSADVVMSLPLTFTADNYMAARLTALTVRNAISMAFAGTACSTAVGYDVIMYPQERFNMLISVENAPADGPAGRQSLSALEMMFRVREVLSALSEQTASEFSLNAEKAVLKNEMESRQTDPDFVIGGVAMRYLYGKDVRTKYAEKIDAVTPERVREIISSLNDGSKIEYVISKTDAPVTR